MALNNRVEGLSDFAGRLEADYKCLGLLSIARSDILTCHLLASYPIPEEYRSLVFWCLIPSG